MEKYQYEKCCVINNRCRICGDSKVVEEFQFIYQPRESMDVKDPLPMKVRVDNIEQYS